MKKIILEFKIVITVERTIDLNCHGTENSGVSKDFKKLFGLLLPNLYTDAPYIVSIKQLTSIFE